MCQLYTKTEKEREREDEREGRRKSELKYFHHLEFCRALVNPIKISI